LKGQDHAAGAAAEAAAAEDPNRLKGIVLLSDKINPSASLIKA
jgi:hypothetical protein